MWQCSLGGNSGLDFQSDLGQKSGFKMHANGTEFKEKDEIVQGEYGDLLENYYCQIYNVKKISTLTNSKLVPSLLSKWKP